ncbi:MAG TPA: hypothetical protein VMB84_04570 [Stellaceae bacterium]|nr:hypothetical protein [Stellaceae bacterium]
MPKIARLCCLIATLLMLAACAGGGAVPANYYENELHHGYPGPAVADPSAI